MRSSERVRSSFRDASGSFLGRPGLFIRPRFPRGDEELLTAQTDFCIYVNASKALSDGEDHLPRSCPAPFA